VAFQHPDLRIDGPARIDPLKDMQLDLGHLVSRLRALVWGLE
jgi:hypothetical protein